MNFNSVPEASNKVKISLALIAFLLIAAIFVTKYVVEQEAKIEDLSKPATEKIDANQIDHVDEALHKLELEFVQIRNDLTQIKEEVKWLKDNCRCR